MKALHKAEDLLRLRFDEMERKCLEGSEESIIRAAFCGTLCCRLLVEQLHIDGSEGMTAVEDVAKVADGWPISYPALDDGRTNRIAEQLPKGLKQRLKIGRSYLKATGHRTGAHQEIEEFLEHARKHDDQSSVEPAKSELAPIMGALILLHRECIKGNRDAVSIVARFGVRVCVMLESLLEHPTKSKVGKSLRSASDRIAEWPLHLRHKEDLMQLKLRVPDNLGKKLGFRITKKTGTKADRDLSCDARSGFALSYFRDLEEARELARKYEDPFTAQMGELINQAAAAAKVLFDPNYQEMRSHVVPKIIKQLPKDLIGLAEKPLSETPPEMHDIAAITKKLLNVVPLGTEQMWNELKELPGLTPKSLKVWIAHAKKLAKLRCKSVWENGEWPPGITTAVENRTATSGAKNQNKLFQEAVGLWLEQGFANIVSDGKQ